MSERKSGAPAAANSPLPLKGTTNTRELGGYPTRDGGTTRRHVLLRSDDLHHATEEDEKWLYDYGIRTVVDLRTAVERIGHLDHDHEENFRRRHVSMMQHVQAELVKDRLLDRPDEALKTWADVYIAMVERLKPQFRDVLETLIHAEQAALFHCTAGRDRTGIVAMFLLTMADVPRETIIADYIASDQYASEALRHGEKIMEALGGDVIPQGAFEATPETMETLIKHLEDKYGSVMGYLEDIGITSADVEALKRKFVEPPAG